MEFFPSYETLSLWLEHYGSISLFFLLASGIIALPVPEESLMVLAGVFIHKGILALPQTLIASYAGSMTGITVSYLLGRTVGHFLIKNLAWIGIGEKQLMKVQHWFDRYGKWTLFIGYFIPGLRHFTGLATGMTGVGYKPFALYAYSGAIFWVSTFVSLGYLFGGYGLNYFENLEFGIESIALVLLVLLLLYCAVIIYKRKTSLSRSR